jgi:hypothetical protein
MLERVILAITVVSLSRFVGAQDIPIISLVAHLMQAHWCHGDLTLHMWIPWRSRCYCCGVDQQKTWGSCKNMLFLLVHEDV